MCVFLENWNVYPEISGDQAISVKEKMPPKLRYKAANLCFQMHVDCVLEAILLRQANSRRFLNVSTESCLVFI